MNTVLHCTDVGLLGKDEPSVQVLLATYNGEAFVRDQLASLWAQTHREFEVLAADDGSSDKTLSLLTAAQPESGGRLKIAFDGRVGGAAQNFMRLLRASAAPYVFLCDQDDVWLPEKIETMLQRMKELEHGSQGTPLLLHSDLSVVDEARAIRHASFFSFTELDPVRCDFTSLLLRNCVTGCATMVNRPLVELAVGGAGSQMIMHDWWLALVAAAFGQIHTLPLPLVQYRQHGRNTLGATRWSAVSIAYRVGQVLSGAARRNPLQRCSEQAKAFNVAYGPMLGEEHREAVLLAASLFELSPLGRRRALLELGVFKQGLKRALVSLFAS